MRPVTDRPRAGKLLPALMALTLGLWGCGKSERLTEFQRAKSGSMDVILLSARDGLHHGKDTFAIDFRTAADGKPVDVGDVRLSAVMPMPGAPMLGDVDVKRTEAAGRYEASSDFSMAGTWRLTVEWNGPAGQGSVTFAGTVQ